jgi:hypothetical protein
MRGARCAAGAMRERYATRLHYAIYIFHRFAIFRRFSLIDAHAIDITPFFAAID